MTFNSMQTCSMQCYKLRVESTVWRDWCQLQHFAQYHIRANHWTKSLWPLWRHRLRIRVHKFDVILFCTYSLQKCILFFRITYNQLQEDLNTFMLLSELSSLSETSIRTTVWGRRAHGWSQAQFSNGEGHSNLGSYFCLPHFTSS